MENAKYTDADRKKVALEIKKQWERWHIRQYSARCGQLAVYSGHSDTFFVVEVETTVGTGQQWQEKS